MKFLLSDEVQVEVYAKMLNMTTRADMTDNKYFQAEPKVQDVAKAIDVARTPYTLKFFELINSPQGPWLQMLQRAYYEDTDLDVHHRRRPGADEGDRRRVTPRAGAGPAGAANPLAKESRECAAQAPGGSRGFSTSHRRSPSCRLHRLAVRADGLHVAAQLVADRRAQVHRDGQLRPRLERPAVLGLARLHP